MTGTELIANFKVVTGRLDLSDAEILRLLNEASRTLDRLENSDKRVFHFFFTINAGGYSAALPAEFRLPKTVIVHNSSGSQTIRYARPESVRAMLRNVALNVDVPSEESYYSIMSGMVTGSVADGDLPLAIDATAKQLIPSTLSKYIIVCPVAAEKTILEVVGVAYTAALTDTNTSNFWSINLPDGLVQAAVYQLTKNLQNPDEANKILSDLATLVRPVSFDLYAEEMISCMEG